MELGDENLSLVLFQQSPVRRAWHDGRWFYSIIDLIAILVTTSSNPGRYWSDLKRKLSGTEGFVQLYAKIVKLDFAAPDGKMRATETADIETVLRIIQSIPSPSVEPMKQWLAQVGADIIDDRTEDQKRIETRDQAIDTKKRLHAEIHGRGVRTAKAHAEFELRGHEIFYGSESLAASKERKGIEKDDEIGEWMGSEETADNLFRDAQSHSYIRRMDIQGKEPVIKAHERVSEKVREFIIDELGGTPPEELPTPQKPLSQVRKEEERRRTKGMDLFPEIDSNSVQE